MAHISIITKDKRLTKIFSLLSQKTKHINNKIPNNSIGQKLKHFLFCLYLCSYRGILFGFTCASI